MKKPIEMKRLLFILVSICFVLPSLNLSGKSADDAYKNDVSKLDKALTAKFSTKVYLNKNGQVPPGMGAIFNFKSTSDEVSVSAIKRGGQAVVWVEVYVNNVFKERLEFTANSRNVAKRGTIKDVKNKSVRIKIVHKSGEEAFQYELSCNGYDAQLKAQLSDSCPRGYTSGTVQAGQPKVMTIRPLCNQIEFIIERKGGRAAAEVIFYLDNIWTSKLVFPKGVNTIQKKKLSPLNGRTIRVEIINKGAQGTTFEYKMKTIQSD